MSCSLAFGRFVRAKRESTSAFARSSRSPPTDRRRLEAESLASTRYVEDLENSAKALENAADRVKQKAKKTREKEDMTSKA